MAAKKKSDKVVPVQAADERYETRNLGEIELSYENTRTHDWTVADGSDSGVGQSFKELEDSIRAAGQRTPVVVRVKGKKLQLVSGFRRYAALKKIAVGRGAQWEKEPIKVVIKNLDEREALIENLAENSREDLSGPDLAFGLHRLEQIELAAGRKPTFRELAEIIGKNAGYCQQLLAIVNKAPKVAKLWWEAQEQLSHRKMYAISKIADANKNPDEKAQLAEYNKLVKGLKEAAKESEGGGSGPGGKPWIKTATEKAEAVAGFLGRLENLGLIECDIAWDENLENLGVRLAKDATGRDKAKIAKAAKEAYVTAKEAEPTEESEQKAAE